jgi:hypothetical protein
MIQPSVQPSAVDPIAEQAEARDAELKDALSGYFALAEAKDIGQRLMEQKEEFYKKLQSSGMYRKMKASWRASYGQSPSVSPGRSDELVHSGEQGELTFINVNHYRNLEQHLLSLTCSQQPDPSPVETNTDYKSSTQTVLAKGLLDYYTREKSLEKHFRICAEHAIKCADGYSFMEWDVDEGDDYDVDEYGKVIRNGDVVLSNPTPLDVIRDLDRDSCDRDDWMMVRQSSNRYEVAARYPALAKDIVTVSSAQDSEAKQWRLTPGKAGTDQIYVYKFFHRKSAAVPDGRYVIVAEGGLVLFDGPIPYEKIPIRRMAPADMMGAPFGYTPLFDLLAIQEAINALYSAVVTNQTSFGVQNIWAPEGANLSYEQLATGLNLIKTTGGTKPEALNLTSTPAEIFKFIEQLEHAQETISGINSVQRGNVPANVESGNALAMMSAQAIQFSSVLQASYISLIQGVYTDLLAMLRTFATTKRVALIVGSYNQYMLKEFSGQDLSNISRVQVDAGSPLTRTADGRAQLAKDLLSVPNSDLTPAQYINVYKTGNLEELTQSKTRELLLIKQENERLASGQPAPVMATDNHVLHIQENKSVLDNPALREQTPENEAIIQATLQHLMQHVQIGSDPALAPLLSSLGYQPIMAMSPPQMGPGGPSGPPGGEPGQDAGPPPQGPPSGQGDGGRFPTNPLTGQEWNPTDGGQGGGSDGGPPPPQ